MIRNQWKRLAVLLIGFVAAAVAGTVWADDNSGLGSPAVPVSQMNRTYSGGHVYIGLFETNADGRWSGNLKKFAVDPDDNSIRDRDGAPATDPDTGQILDSAKSFWSIGNDGGDVLAGGAGARLYLDRHLRTVYTKYPNFFGSPFSLYDFSVTNGGLTAEKLKVPPEQRDALISDVLGIGRTFGEEQTPWIMGDVVHSSPAVARLGDKTCIFVGANDGMLHCFLDEDGSELWSFIPEDLLPKLKRLTDDNPVHDYFVDGAIKVVDSGEDKILFFGERRGGDAYHALSVTHPERPAYLYNIGPDHLLRPTGGILGNILNLLEGESLGQSWGKPLAGTIKTGKEQSAKVILLPGGYDTNQDLDTPKPIDQKGRAVFAIKASDGQVLNNFTYYYNLNWS
ncbi:MAG: hypothetical protein HKP58_07070, partial [Desulfatitalea sp.]|nr:hypothetical protein [Desulfatitalea sp.]NNK00158.1 hypothetical protein [Desulfatitalea sp.]